MEQDTNSATEIAASLAVTEDVLAIQQASEYHADMTQPISKALRGAIESAPVSRYRIAQETGVEQSVLSRFARGLAGIDLQTADSIAAYLKLELRPMATKGRKR